MCVLVAASQNSSPRGDGGSMPWNIANVFPPARVPLIRRKIVRVNICLPVRHRAAGEINKRDRACESVVEKKCSLVGA